MKSTFAAAALLILAIAMTAGADDPRDNVEAPDPSGTPHSFISGGNGGSAFTDTLPPAERLTQIRVRSGIYVDGVQFVWGQTVGAHHGGGGGKEHVINLLRGEYVTGISGRSGKFIDAITIHTNQRTYGPYGGAGGFPFRIDAPAGYEIEGLRGGSAKYLDRVGVVVRSRKPLPKAF